MISWSQTPAAFHAAPRSQKRDPDWRARSIYYLARMLAQQLNRGDDYTRLKSVIGIYLLDFDLNEGLHEQRQAVWCYELRDRLGSESVLSDEVALNFVELRKADRLASAGAQPGVGAALAAWVMFLEHWHEEARMAQIDYSPVQQALCRVRELSADEEARRLAFVRERAERDERSAMGRSHARRATHGVGLFRRLKLRAALRSASARSARPA